MMYVDAAANPSDSGFTADKMSRLFQRGVELSGFLGIQRELEATTVIQEEEFAELSSELDELLIGRLVTVAAAKGLAKNPLERFKAIGHVMGDFAVREELLSEKRQIPGKTAEYVPCDLGPGLREVRGKVVALDFDRRSLVVRPSFRRSIRYWAQMVDEDGKQLVETTVH